jgi:hypothetical protein
MRAWVEPHHKHSPPEMARQDFARYSYCLPASLKQPVQALTYYCISWAVVRLIACLLQDGARSPVCQRLMPIQGRTRHPASTSTARTCMADRHRRGAGRLLSLSSLLQSSQLRGQRRVGPRATHFSCVIDLA